ncbi:signal-induced proliferation-associated 1 protein 2-like, partial [Tropilaelaps mercedesae]
ETPPIVDARQNRTDSVAVNHSTALTTAAVLVRRRKRWHSADRRCADQRERTVDVAASKFDNGRCKPLMCLSVLDLHVRSHIVDEALIQALPKVEENTGEDAKYLRYTIGGLGRLTKENGTSENPSCSTPRGILIVVYRERTEDVNIMSFVFEFIVPDFNRAAVVLCQRGSRVQFGDCFAGHCGPCQTSTPTELSSIYRFASYPWPAEVLTFLVPRTAAPVRGGSAPLWPPRPSQLPEDEPTLARRTQALIQATQQSHDCVPLHASLYMPHVACRNDAAITTATAAASDHGGGTTALSADGTCRGLRVYPSSLEISTLTGESSASERGALRDRVAVQASVPGATWRQTLWPRGRRGRVTEVADGPWPQGLARFIFYQRRQPSQFEQRHAGHLSGPQNPLDPLRLPCETGPHSASQPIGYQARSKRPRSQQEASLSSGIGRSVTVGKRHGSCELLSGAALAQPPHNLPGAAGGLASSGHRTGVGAGVGVRTTARQLDRERTDVQKAGGRFATLHSHPKRTASSDRAKALANPPPPWEASPVGLLSDQFQRSSRRRSIQNLSQGSSLLQRTERQQRENQTNRFCSTAVGSAGGAIASGRFRELPVELEAALSALGSSAVPSPPRPAPFSAMTVTLSDPPPPAAQTGDLQREQRQSPSSQVSQTGEVLRPLQTRQHAQLDHETVALQSSQLLRVRAAEFYRANGLAGAEPSGGVGGHARLFKSGSMSHLNNNNNNNNSPSISNNNNKTSSNSVLANNNNSLQHNNNAQQQHGKLGQVASVPTAGASFGHPDFRASYGMGHHQRRVTSGGGGALGGSMAPAHNTHYHSQLSGGREGRTDPAPERPQRTHSERQPAKPMAMPLLERKRQQQQQPSATHAHLPLSAQAANGHQHHHGGHRTAGLHRSNSSLDLEQHLALGGGMAAPGGGGLQTRLVAPRKSRISPSASEKNVNLSLEEYAMGVGAAGGSGGRRRDYGSASSLDVLGTTGDSFFAMLREYRGVHGVNGSAADAAAKRASAVPAIPLDQRSAGPAKIQEYLRGKLTGSAALAATANQYAAPGVTVVNLEHQTSGGAPESQNQSSPGALDAHPTATDSPKLRSKFQRLLLSTGDKHTKSKEKSKDSGGSHGISTPSGSSESSGGSGPGGNAPGAGSAGSKKKLVKAAKSEDWSNREDETAAGGGSGAAQQGCSGAQSAALDSSRLEDRLRKKLFAHYDCQSLTANLTLASRLRNVLAKRRNTTTGASAASQLGDNCEGGDGDTGDGRFNELVHNCPFFRNELGGEEERQLALNRFTANRHKNLQMTDRDYRTPASAEAPFKTSTLRQTASTGPSSSADNGSGFSATSASSAYTQMVHKPMSACGLSVLESSGGAAKWKFRPCPYEVPSSIIEGVDHGATFYRTFFENEDHQNWLGIDEELGPIAISIKKERVGSTPLPTALASEGGRTQDHASHHHHNSYRLIIRTSGLNDLRGTILEDAIPGLWSGSSSGSSSRKGREGVTLAREVIEFVAPEIQLACLRLATPAAEQQLLKLDEQKLNNTYKVGVLYCKAGQSTEEEMYNNETAGPAFDEFLDVLGRKINLKDFAGYKGGLDCKTDTTGTQSVYNTFEDYEVMFHVSTLLPYTPANRQQILRKRHIGNDIVTIVFQEPGSLQFTPKNIRSRFQHVFVVVRAQNPCTEHTRYKVAITRSRDIAAFGPPLPEGATFERDKKFISWLLAKVINAENAAHRSHKFATMAQRTRQECIRDLATHLVLQTSLTEGSNGRFSLLNSFGGRSSKKDKASHVMAQRLSQLNQAGCYVPDRCVREAISWQVLVEDCGAGGVLIEAHLAISAESIAVVEASTGQVVFGAPTSTVLGFSSVPGAVRIFYHQGESLLVKVREHDLPMSGGAVSAWELDEVREICSRLEDVSGARETVKLVIERNAHGQLGFHVNYEGIVQEVEKNGNAYAAGLRPGARLVEACHIAVATLTYDQLVDVLKTSTVVTVTIVLPYTQRDGNPYHIARRGCGQHNCSYLEQTVGEYESRMAFQQRSVSENAFSAAMRYQQTPPPLPLRSNSANMVGPRCEQSSSVGGLLNASSGSAPLPASAGSGNGHDTRTKPTALTTASLGQLGGGGQLLAAPGQQHNYPIRMSASAQQIWPPTGAAMHDAVSGHSAAVHSQSSPAEGKSSPLERRTTLATVNAHAFHQQQQQQSHLLLNPAAGPQVSDRDGMKNLSKSAVFTESLTNSSITGGFQVASCGLSLSGQSASCGEDERLSPCSSVGGASSGASSRLGGCINIVTVQASPAKAQLRSNHVPGHGGGPGSGSHHSISPVSQLADGSSSASNSNCNTLDSDWRRLSIEALAGGGLDAGKDLQQLQGFVHDDAAAMAAAGGGGDSGLRSGGNGPLHATSLHALHGTHAGSSAGSGRLSQASSCAPSLHSAQSGHSGMSRNSGDRDRSSQPVPNDDPHELALKVAELTNHLAQEQCEKAMLERQLREIQEENDRLKREKHDAQSQLKKITSWWQYGQQPQQQP